MRQRSASLVWVLLLGAAGASGWLLFRGRPGGIEPLIPIVRESCIPLMLDLDAARQGAGYPPDTNFVMPLADKDRSVDDDGIPLPMPLAGDVVFPGLPVHNDPVLEFGYGIEQVRDAQARGALISFSVSVRASGTDEDWRELFRDRLTCGAPGVREERRRGRAALPPELVGRRADLRLATACDRTLAELAVLPAFLSPKLLSAGVKTRMESVQASVPVVLADLLDRYEEAIEADEEWQYITHTTTPEFCFAVRRDHAGGEPRLLPIATSGVAPAFETDDRFRAARGGTRPALFFDFDHTIARYPVEIPSGDVRLEFAIGVDFRCIGVGVAEFLITADGEELFSAALDPEVHPEQRGWHECSVDLAPFAGRTILLGFHGEVFLREPRTIELKEPVPLCPAVPYSLEVKRVRGAFARPRVVRYEEVQQRLSRKDGRPSVVFVNVEAFRADAPSCGGGPEGITPALDRLAVEGTRVERCVTAASWTSPSVASLFTGVHPPGHGVESYAASYLSDSADTLAECLANAGVTTAAFCTNELISEHRNFDQGFQTFFLAPYANARQMVATFEDWLVDHRDRQFFAFLHLFEPHHPFNAPGADLERYVPERLRGAAADQALARIDQQLLAGQPPDPDADDVQLLKALYLGEVRYLDRQLERLRRALEAAGLRERVVIVVTGDHGEEFCEHGLIGHGSHLFGESVEVPLVFWGPGVVPAGQTIAGPVENPALFATILELMDVPYDRDAVRPALRLSGRQPGGRVFTSTAQGIRRIDVSGECPQIYTKSIYSIRTATSSFIYSKRSRPDERTGQRDAAEYQLFDLSADPLERNNIHPGAPALLEEMKQALLKAYEGSRRRRGLGVEQLDAETQRNLFQLGYLDGTRTDDDEGPLFEEDR